MPVIPLKLTGGSYESRTKPLSSQRTLNMYPELVPDGNAPSALLCWPGDKLFSSGSSANRGILSKVWKSHVYLVNGTDLIKLSSSKVQSVVGSIPGAGRCVFAATPNYVYVVTGGNVYRCDGSSTSQVTDTDLETPNAATFINSVLVYDGDGGRFVVSNPGDGGNIDPLNYATAESACDDLIRPYAYKQMVLMCGTDTIEPWYHSGSGSPPLDRIDQAILQVGIAGAYSITHTTKAVYFLGSDRAPYRLEGYTETPISDPAIAHTIEQFADVSDCICDHARLQDQNFIIFSFPSANKTFAYSERYGSWLELSSGVNYERHLFNGHCYAFGKHLITDYSTGNVYEWDINTFDSNGDPLVRERVVSPVFSEQYTEGDKPIFWNSLKLVINSGNGLITGQGSDPQVMMQYSDDGGMTWSSELWESAGQAGAYTWEVEWFGLGSAVNRIYKFRVTDPIEFHMFKLFADIEVGI